MFMDGVKQVPHAALNRVLGLKSERIAHFLKINAVISRIRTMLLITHFGTRQQGNNYVDYALFGEVVNLAASVKYLKCDLGSRRLNYLPDEAGKIPFELSQICI